MRALVHPATKELRKRNDVWREIISTEESYVHSLRLLEEVRRRSRAIPVFEAGDSWIHSHTHTLSLSLRRNSSSP